MSRPTLVSLALVVALVRPSPAEVPHAVVESGLRPGTAMAYRPLGYWPAHRAFLVERQDRRAEGSETSWMLYDRAMSLLGYVTLFTDAGLSGEHIQWTGTNAATQRALSELITAVRERLATTERRLWSAAPAKFLKEQPGWLALKPTRSCPVQAARHGDSVELSVFDAATRARLPVAVIEAAASPSDEKRGCAGSSVHGALRCAAGADRDVLVVVPFQQNCEGTIHQEQLVLYDPSALEYLKHDLLGAAALKKNDLAGARRSFEESLRLEPRHAEARFHLACVLARLGVAFSDGRKELEQILESEEQRLTWLPRIKREPDLAPWQKDPGFARWILEFPTR
jgi:hypothetical protein